MPQRSAVTAPSPPPTTFPCPGCGRPVAVGAVLCTHCGQHIGREEQLETRLGRPERGLAPIPAVAPGPAAFRDAPKDPLARSEVLKPFIVLALSLAVVTLWKLAEDGPPEAAGYLLRYAITLAGGLAIALTAALTFVEVGVSIPLAAASIAAAIAGGDLTQHIIHYTLMPALAWMAAIGVCLALLADFLDIDLPEAVFLAFAIYLLKWALKFMIFDAMFAAPAAQG